MWRLVAQKSYDMGKENKYFIHYDTLEWKAATYKHGQENHEELIHTKYKMIKEW